MMWRDFLFVLVDLEADGRWHGGKIQTVDVIGTRLKVVRDVFPWKGREGGIGMIG